MKGAKRGGSQGLGQRLITAIVDRPAVNRTESALLWGLAWLIITAIIGWYFRIVPTSSFGAIPVGYISLLNHVIINLTVWITACVLPFLFAVLLNRKTRVVELFGRMLFAHWPVVILMLPALVSDKISYAIYMSNMADMDLAATFSYQPIYSTILTVIVCIVSGWYIYWSYLAFSTATRRGGHIIFLLLIGVIQLSWWLSDVVVESMMSSMLK